MTALLAIFGFSMAVSISAVQITAGLLILVVVIQSIRDRKNWNWHSTPLDIPLLVFILWSMIAAAVTHSTTLWNSVSSLNAILIYFLMTQSQKFLDWKVSVRWFVMGSVIVGYLGLIQVSSGAAYNGNHQFYMVPHFFSAWPHDLLRYISTRASRAVGTRSHPLTYAESLIPAFYGLTGIIVARFIQKENSVRMDLKEILGWAGVALGILLSQSRGVWLGLCVGLIPFFLSIPRRAQLFMLVGGFILITGLFSMSTGLRGRALSIVSKQSGQLGDQQSSSTRLELWQLSLVQLKEKPIFGNGPEGTKLANIDPATGLPRVWSDCHNVYLQATLDRGLIGLGLLIWILIVCATMIGKLPLMERGIFFATFLAFLIAGLTESWLRDSVVAMIFFSYMGFVQVRLNHLGEA